MKILLVGYGMAGRQIHTPLMIEAGGAPSVVATANPERIAQVHQDLPGAEVVAGLEEGLARGPIDLVVLASPTGAHVDGALACIAAGVPVVVDKPLAVDAPGAQRVVDAAATAGAPLTVFLNRRWDAENLTLARLLAEQDDSGRTALGQVHRFERRWDRWRPQPLQRWREQQSAEQGGGVLLDLGVHLVDSAVQLFGPVDQVYGEISAVTTASDDSVFLALRHTNGIRSHLNASSIAAVPGPRTRVLGTRAGYLVSQFPGAASVLGIDDAPGCTGWLYEGESPRPVPTAPGAPSDFYRAVFTALALTDPVAQQAAMPVDPADAVVAQRILDASRLSSAQGVVVDVTEDGEAPGS